MNYYRIQSIRGCEMHSRNFIINREESLCPTTSTDHKLKAMNVGPC